MYGVIAGAGKCPEILNTNSLQEIVVVCQEIFSVKSPLLDFYMNIELCFSFSTERCFLSFQLSCIFSVCNTKFPAIRA